MAEENTLSEMTEIVKTEQVQSRIYTVRGQNVMQASDLAELYGVETFILNRAVKRNAERFPDDFMFQLTAEETQGLRFHFGISNEGKGRGGRRYLPYVFTEQGVAMLSSVLRSERAVQVNIFIMRAFVAMRQMMLSDADLARKILAMEQKYDRQFQVVFEAIRRLIEEPPAPPERRMGFRAQKEEPK